MFVVGLTGGIGSGKSEAARLFAALGVPVIDVDHISHQLTAPGQPILQDIANALGRQFLSPDGKLDRAALRTHVFADNSARLQLEKILHPAIRQAALLQLAANQNSAYQILSIPLLFEGDGYRTIVNRTLVIDCDEAQQIQRTMRRSGLTEQAVRAIMAAQISRAQRNQLADDIIENNGTLSELSQKILEKHKNYLQACIVSQ